jgi:hypothetical protein
MQVNKFVESDLTYLMSKKKYDDKLEYFQCSFSFVNNICIMEKCEADGSSITNSWDVNKEYIACKLEDGHVMVIDSRTGWVRAEDATNRYSEILAEKELLS